MGQEICSGCKKPAVTDTSLSHFRPTALQSSWADAVKNGNLMGVETLHATDMYLIDEPVDGYNICAIHIVIQYQYYDILDYLLTQHFDINMQDNKNGNTALHLAAMNEDAKAIEKLFTYDEIDESIKNDHGQTPIYLCSTEFKREYIKSKERGKAVANKRRKRSHKNGGNVNYFSQSHQVTNYLTLNNGYNANNSDLNGMYRSKGKFITKFAKETGVDIDEMAMFLKQQQRNDSKKDIWDKYIKDGKDIIKKEKDMEKLLNGICLLTKMDKKKHLDGIKNGHIMEEKLKPNKHAIQQLTVKICDILKQENDDTNKIRLSKQDFNNRFHDHLDHIHLQILNRRFDE